MPAVFLDQSLVYLLFSFFNILRLLTVCGHVCTLSRACAL